MPDAIAWTDEIPPGAAVAVCGPKMGRLAELRAAGVRVPPGFTLTVAAFAQFWADTGLDEVAGEVLTGLQAGAADDDLETAAGRMQAEIIGQELPPDLAGRLTEAYDELSDRCAEVNVPTAVRSSAVGEDSGEASFAGIFESYLGVSGPGRLVTAVQRCWASLYSARALAYRLRGGLPAQASPMAVGVVELIHARASGVAFSAHPVTGKTDRIVIETNWGWGEAVVQGLVTPDHVELDKSDGRVLRYQVADKQVVSAFDYAAGQVVQIPMPPRLAGRRVLAEEQIEAVAGAVRAVEAHYGYPVDVEWVLDRHRRPGDPVYVVQARPVTVTGPGPQPGGWDPVAMATRYAFGR